MKSVIFLISALVLVVAEPTIWFKEEFADGDAWEQRWVSSQKKPSESGKFKLTAGKFYGDSEKDKGIQTSEDARFYAISSKFEKPVNNEGKTLVIQFQAKHEQKIDCGGGYIKVFPHTLDQSQLEGETQYYVMFGPDICGYSTKKVHVIFNYKGKNLLRKNDISLSGKDDEFTHLYTLIVKPDNSYVVKIDNEEAEKGKLEEDFEFLAPKKIKDPAASKPDDWDEREFIPDETDTKPEEAKEPEEEEPEEHDHDHDDHDEL